MAGDQGKFSTDIGDDVIQEALKSVARRTGEVPAVPSAGEAPPEAPATRPAPVAAAAGEAPKLSEMEELKAELDFSQAKSRELMEKLKDTHERMLRAAADLDNFRKRAQKEKEEIQKFGAEKLLKDFLPVIDNLDRALAHALSAADYESLHKGVEMTRKLFEDTLGRHGVKGFSAVGHTFDPRLHEAMQQVPTADAPPNTVVSELVRGYLLNERLIRPALVAVSVPASEAPSASLPPAEPPKS